LTGIVKVGQVVDDTFNHTATLEFSLSFIGLVVKSGLFEMMAVVADENGAVSIRFSLSRATPVPEETTGTLYGGEAKRVAVVGIIAIKG
jgi:hypothetical protein